MKNRVYLFLLITFVSLLVSAQKNETIPGIGLPLISQVNQGNSYITFPGDIGNIEPLWFEGNVIPNFYLRQSQNSRLMGVLTPQIIIRMYQEESFPVRTPSYMPQLTVYYRLTELDKTPGLNLFGRVAHHSNGQDGDFFLEDGSINTKSGNFATNFLELGFIATNLNTRFNAYQFFKTSFEVHPEGFIQEELMGIYSRYRWHNSFSIFKLNSGSPSSNGGRPAISLKGETTWMFGDYNQLDAFSAERLNLSLTFYYHPKFLEDIGLFVQYYHGSDYYNMYFDHRLDVLRFGFMTEKLRF
ncbi:hypothetical protein [uncultured Draconibacterium sp.]|uniref:hypothetical protein n=1 Tax=uncultured Draconibacterium sp. TaxID=1573823 RepID=UPI0032170968